MLFQISGIIILLMFYGCYFTKMGLQKKKGIQTNQIGKGKSGTVKVIENVMKITTFLVPIIEIISIYLNATKFHICVRILVRYLLMELRNTQIIVGKIFQIFGKDIKQHY